MLRARTPPGIAQEIYALLITYQALRLAISDAVLTRPEVDPDRGSFTIALNAARDQLTAALGVLADTAHAAVDLVGEIGSQVLDHLMPHRAPAPTRAWSNAPSPSTPPTTPAAGPGTQPHNYDHDRHPQRVALTRSGTP